MPIRPIVKYGDPVLHSSAAPVERIDDSIRALLTDMVETMYAAPGIGLAAPQIGVPLRVIVIDLSVGEDRDQLIQLVNPDLVVREGDQRHEEGCLSVPGYGGSPVRPARHLAAHRRSSAIVEMPSPLCFPRPRYNGPTTQVHQRAFHPQGDGPWGRDPGEAAALPSDCLLRRKLPVRISD